MKTIDQSKTESKFDALIKASIDSVFNFRPEYNWVGIYLLSGDTLTVQKDHYIGLTTDSDVIPITDGIVGACARARETIIVDDVNADDRYIACSISVKSEIVVPIMSDETVVGVLDLDSDTPAAFGAADKVYLEGIAAELAASWEFASLDMG